MQTLILHRTFLKKPKNGLLLLLVIVLLANTLIFVLRPDLKLQFVRQLTFNHISAVLLSTVVPEFVSLIVLMLLINQYHLLLKLEKLNLTVMFIIRYELMFMPLFAIAFFVFFPITLHIRFLLREFPVYDWNRYYLTYFSNGFSFNTYLLYLPFVFILGYALLNVSMFIDFSKSNSHPAPLQNVEKETVVVVENFDITSGEELVEETTTAKDGYLTLIEAKTMQGTIFLNAEDCYYFILIGTYDYFVEHPDGRFKIVQSISVLEAGLDPLIFCRCNRKAILNLNYASSFVYLDKGKYSICMKSPLKAEFSITKARMEIFKEALKMNIESKKKKK